jgi:hypothetical protein
MRFDESLYLFLLRFKAFGSDDLAKHLGVAESLLFKEEMDDGDADMLIKNVSLKMGISSDLLKKALESRIPVSELLLPWPTVKQHIDLVVKIGGESLREWDRKKVKL